MPSYLDKIIAWQQLFSSGWKVFETRFGHILENLQHHKILIETQANLLEIKAAQTERAMAETQFEETTKQRDKEKCIAIAAWLDGAKSHIDQLDAKAEREAYPQSGRWLLGCPQMRSWLDFTLEDKPLLWIRGIPGAGNHLLPFIRICRSVVANRNHFLVDYLSLSTFNFLVWHDYMLMAAWL